MTVKIPVILVAEDEAPIRSLICEFLSDSGFRVLEADSAEAALALLDARAVDLVFTDVNMPGRLKGDALAQWLAVHCPQLPVIITSGMLKPQVCGYGRRFIPKPYELADVENQIRDLLH
jgi:CheY-like chemotaxis protein